VGWATVRLSRPDVSEDQPAVGTETRRGFLLDADVKNLVADSDSTFIVDLVLRDGDSAQSLATKRLPVSSIDSHPQVAPVNRLLQDLEIRLGHRPAVLDLTGRLPATMEYADTVFAPVERQLTMLRYLSASVDVVVCSSDDAAQSSEARRVAKHLVVADTSAGWTAAWRAGYTERHIPRVSIIIPAHGNHELTQACLYAIREVTPRDLLTEIIVVDDGSPTEVAEALGAIDDVRFVRHTATLGFGAACNTGASAARGELIAFLNNDTIPAKNWLEPLVSILDDQTVGAVGAKLIYPNGVLQEAGGVVFADGSAWNFGNGGDPDDPLFNSVREVDYCSAAALITRRELFLAVSGFDLQYSPAYYEDTDYCFKLRSHGFRIIYQPASIVVHREGATAGKDEHSGVKRFQSANRQKFVDTWRRSLQAQPASTLLTRKALHRHVTRQPSARRVLIWSPIVPEHDKESGSRRVFDVIRYFLTLGCVVTYVAEDATGGERYLAALRQMGVIAYAGPRTRWAGTAYLARPFDLLSEAEFAVVVFHFWWLAERHIEAVRQHSPGSRVIVDSIDLHFVRHARRRVLFRTEDATLSNGLADDEFIRELRTYASADRVLTVSEAERRILTDVLGRLSRPRVLVDAEQRSPSPVPHHERRGLLFLGNFRHDPNIDALSFLIRSIVPMLPQDLLARHPLMVVGTDLGTALEKVGRVVPEARLVGWVPSIDPYVDSAAVMVAPLRYGAGTKRKMIQSALAGTPIVATTIAAEGLELVHGRHLLIADSAEEFARQLRRVLEDAALWGQLSDSAAAVIRERHSEAVACAQLEAILHEFDAVDHYASP
jgi:GT2 family glycosyltransferase